MEEPAIPAATLVVMRDVPAGGPPELLMVTRPATMAFAGGAMVFPGGRVDASDRDLGAGWGEDGPFRAAALRETLEEAGLPVGLNPLPSPDAALALQDALISGVALADLLAEHSLVLAPETLVPFARWRPAFHQARRFDTMFFLAQAPPGTWVPRPQAGECDSAEWLSAAAVLSRIAAGTATAIFPTIRNLERLALFNSFDEARAQALAHPVEVISPWVEEVDGQKWLRIPDHLGYPVTSEILTSAIRA
jgi:8-oxo-dGTP pyrophosphatase MutT (NUDIX family)